LKDGLECNGEPFFKGFMTDEILGYLGSGTQHIATIVVFITMNIGYVVIVSFNCRNWLIFVCLIERYANKNHF
jgi:hypothetical protein